MAHSDTLGSICDLTDTPGRLVRFANIVERSLIVDRDLILANEFCQENRVNGNRLSKKQNFPRLLGEITCWLETSASLLGRDDRLDL